MFNGFESVFCSHHVVSLIGEEFFKALADVDIVLDDQNGLHHAFSYWEEHIPSVRGSKDCNFAAAILGGVFCGRETRPRQRGATKSRKTRGRAPPAGLRN